MQMEVEKKKNKEEVEKPLSDAEDIFAMPNAPQKKKSRKMVVVESSESEDGMSCNSQMKMKKLFK